MIAQTIEGQEVAPAQLHAGFVGWFQQDFEEVLPAWNELPTDSQAVFDSILSGMTRYRDYELQEQGCKPDCIKANRLVIGDQDCPGNLRINLFSRCKTQELLHYPTFYTFYTSLRVSPEFILTFLKAK